MDGWIAIIVLTIIGLVLIYAELIFIPGTTVLGVLGLILVGVGVYMAYDNYGTVSGSVLLVSSLALMVGALVYSFRSKSWEKLTLKNKNDGKVNEDYNSGLYVGMAGMALSDLKPIGKAEFDNKSYEVTSHGYLIESESEIKILKLTGNKIIVEQINP